MKLDEQYIKSLPLTTNKIDVKFDNVRVIYIPSK